MAGMFVSHYRRHMKKLLFMPILFICTTLYADPSISDYADGSISGTGFGIKSPAKPYLWAPFDVDSSPSNLGLITSWSNIYAMAWDADEGADGGGCLKSTDNIGVWTAQIIDYSFGWNDYGQKCYVFRKLKRNFDVFTDNAAGGGEINWKEFRMWPHNVGTNYPNVYYATHNGALGAEGVSTPTSGLYGNPSKMAGPVNEYFINEFWFQSNSAEANQSGESGDGSFVIENNGKRAVTVPYEAYDGIRYYKAKEEGQESIVQFYPIHGVKANATMPGDALYWADDVYVDTTWARVMIGNASTLEASTHREIQIPTAWSDTEITFTFNQGSFNVGDSAYLFVVDADGTASAGHPITIGANTYTGFSKNTKAGTEVTISKNVKAGSTLTISAN